MIETIEPRKVEVNLKYEQVQDPITQLWKSVISIGYFINDENRTVDLTIVIKEIRSLLEYIEKKKVVK